MVVSQNYEKGEMSKQSVIGVYDNLSEAEDAVRALHERRFPMESLYRR
jgi:hypothetical protein